MLRFSVLFALIGASCASPVNRLLQELAEEASLLLQNDDGGEGCLLMQSDVPPEQNKEACLLLQGTHHNMGQLAIGANAEAEADLDVSALSQELSSSSSTSSIERFATKLQSVVQAAAEGSPIDPVTKEMLTDIEDTMQQILNNTLIGHDADVQEMANSVDSIEMCANLTIQAHENEGQINDMARAIDSERSNHSNCRDEEADLNASMISSCTTYSDFRDVLQTKRPPCSCKDRFPRGQEHVKHEEAREWVRQVPEQKVKHCLTNSHSWSDGALLEFYSKRESCSSSRDLYSKKRKECSHKQKLFEANFCQYTQLLRITCASQKTCRKERIAAHEKLCAAIAVNVHARKAETFASKKVQCYIGMLKSEDYTDYRRCERLEVDRSHLDIACAPVPPAAPCDTSPVTHAPCNAAWLDAEYVTKTWYADATPSECTACISGGDDAPNPFPEPTQKPFPPPRPDCETTCLKFVSDPTAIQTEICQTETLAFNEVTVNTLGSVDGGELRYKDVLAINGRPVDLVITDKGKYDKYNQHAWTAGTTESRKNAQSMHPMDQGATWHGAGRLAMTRGHYTFNFKLVYSDDGSKVTQMKRFPMVMYDVDGPTEEVTSCDSECAITCHTQLNETRDESTGCRTFKSPGMQVQMPTDFEQLSYWQRAVSATFVYHDSTFDMDMVAKQDNRIFLFKSSKAVACAIEEY